MAIYNDSYDSKELKDVYLLGQAWQYYIGTDLAYRPRESFIANALK